MSFFLRTDSCVMNARATESKSSQLGLLKSLIPNRIVGILTAAGAILELTVVFTVSSSMATTDFPTKLFAVTYIAWFWITIGWVICLTGRYWRWIAEKESRVNRFALRASVLVSSLLLIQLYAISWGLLVRTGSIANLESIRFLLFNYSHLWNYLIANEPIHLAVMFGLTVTSIMLLPLLFRLASEVDPRISRRRRIAAWLAVTVVVRCLWTSIPYEASVLKRANRLRAISTELHPSFTLIVSFCLNSKLEPIRPEIQPHRLRPVDPAHRQITHDNLGDVERLSVILIQVESLRHDTIGLHHQGKEVLPNINQLAKNGVHFTHCYAQSTHSDYADVCIVSSLYPLRTRLHHYYGETDPWPRTLIYDVLKPYGYSTAIISSQNEAWGSMDKFLASSSLDLFYHPETAADGDFMQTSTMDPGFSREVRLGTLRAGKFTDQHTTGQAIQWIRKQIAENRPFFLSMNLQSSHFPYLIPQSCERPFQPCTLDSRISFVEYPETEVPRVRNAYYNAVRECDRQVGRLVAELKSLGRWEDTIIIVTGENGEAFHECGGKVSHAREPVEPAIHVACVIHAPKLLEPKREPYPLEHVDLMPTLLGLLKLPAHPNFQGINVFSNHRPAAEDRYTFAHVNSSLAYGDSIMLRGRWKLWIDRHAQRPSLFDTWNDPNEEHDLIDSHTELLAELEKTVTEWRDQQLSYYHFPHYFLSYYPPLPPTRDEMTTRTLQPSDATVQRRPSRFSPTGISALTVEAALSGRSVSD
jgi:arylsulfatase A-like enzyme